ncbi:MAG: hypothetical protein EOO57_15025 [Hymenobacter sp.]|nr:MAG: hypothetical protein EOO57_15025 [Hymenobacter sp.]
MGGAVPLRRGPSLTRIGALSVRSFAWYIAHCLAPTLRSGDVLVFDNLAVHKIGGLREWLVARGVEVLFLPPCSPDFSPIAQAWRKLKTKLRACAARSYEALQETLHEAIDWITSPDARNWFDHCGYHTQPA